MATKKKAAARKAAQPAAKAAAYSKEQLMRARRYTERKDLINALLEDNRQYTIAEVDAAIAKYMKGTVN